VTPVLTGAYYRTAFFKARPAAGGGVISMPIITR
jgi:hypothetical protein